MIREIHIENFKSVDQLTLDLGRVNVLIGANGCGKTNILEAICFGGAAAAGKLDNEYLAPRGIRYSVPRSMRSGFSKDQLTQPINLKFVNGERVTFEAELTEEGTDFPSWKATVGEQIKHTPDGSPISSRFNLTALFSRPENFNLDERTLRQVLKVASAFRSLQSFLIYAPDPITVRRLEDEERTLPLGINGAGLFRLLQTFSAEKLAELKSHLHVIDWFDDLELPESRLPGERTLRIRDQFIADGLQYFEQRSANEGFLFLLFYLSLFISEHTPPFFAIDNLDNGLNPKLCAYLSKTLAELAAKHEKQVILTTHNPAVLDGIDLKDDEQRLFVVYRNVDGRTRVRRVVPKDLPHEGEPVRLSEAFLRGYIGGLPKNF